MVNMKLTHPYKHIDECNTCTYHVLMYVMKPITLPTLPPIPLQLSFFSCHGTSFASFRVSSWAFEGDVLDLPLNGLVPMCM